MNRNGHIILPGFELYYKIIELKYCVIRNIEG